MICMDIALDNANKKVRELIFFCLKKNIKKFY